ncbi:4-hydroxythreonine-4-phosphate dehydrogenase PdxA [Blastomonas sp.]|uniref:4-hydroxythreonine-4-phosphate dehydrogenase PdxA n=1 Tax=Blastomonas sp. TaxID=1909299 RepID=UPI0035938A05
MSELLAISSGDPSGIGPEIIGKCWDGRHAADLPGFFAIGDPAAFALVWNGPTRLIDTPAQAAEVFECALPIMPVVDSVPAMPGHPDLDGARCALQALEMGVGLARAGQAQGIVTGPVSKIQLQKVGFNFPGQTEYIAESCGVARQNVAMLLAGPSLRVVPITVHIRIADVPAALSIDLIVNRARATAKGMARNFGITRPRIAIAGLNPHAGEQGAMGSEEADIIAPAIDILRAEGFDVAGPLPADTMFHAAARARYDVALCQYHDQALIPIKALHFDDAVNMTLGLPIVRTSPDHGTAFDIAGKGLANPSSMIAAIRMAGAAWQHRQNYEGP